MSQTHDGQLVVRLRKEGHGVVMSIPQSVRAELSLRAGDIMVVVAEGGGMIARKVDLRALVATPAPNRESEV